MTARGWETGIIAREPREIRALQPIGLDSGMSTAYYRLCILVTKEMIVRKEVLWVLLVLSVGVSCS